MKMKQKVMSVLLAAGMVAGLAVPALADSSIDYKAVKGQGEIGIFDLEEKTDYPYINKVDVGATKVDGNRAVPGATITVLFPKDGEVDIDDQSYEKYPEQYTPVEVEIPDDAVTADWEITTLPSGIDMSKGMKIYAYQEEEGKLRSDRQVVTIGSNMGSDKDDEDENGGGETKLPLEYLDVTIPNTFYWYVNQETGVDAQGNNYVQSPVHYVTNNRTTLELDGQELKATVEVGLASFTYEDTYHDKLNLKFVDKKAEASTTAGDVVSFLSTFDKTANINVNDADGYVPTNGILAQIGQKESIAFGFDGTWGGTVGSEKQTPAHTMMLSFEVINLEK